MKRTFLLLFTFVLFLFFLTGCEKTLTTDLPTIMQDINFSEDYIDMKIIEDVSELETYYLINPAYVKSFAVEISKEESDFTEIILVEAVDIDKANEISSLLDNYYRTKLDMAQTYEDEFAKLLQKCSVKQNGVYVSLIICDNVNEVEKIYNSYFE
ncbi:MAG: DUF4358 domain-containing protein [Ruminococcus sp.]|nr:DUF4358 domain-containing protein [Ruminococcus sp.]